MAATKSALSIEKMPTGIHGFDAITGGGLPRSRTTLLLGSPGAGKTIFALETLVNGALQHGESGIFIAFEENSSQIIENASTFGWDLASLERDKLFFLDAKLPSTVLQSGNFDLVGMLGGLTSKATDMCCKRIVFDGIDVLLGLLDDPVAERQEVYRLHEWLIESGSTGIITAKMDEADNPASERYAFMQFMVDTVVSLHHRLVDRVSLRGLRVMKYRGSAFLENEFPLIISPTGIEVATFGTDELAHEVSTERVSSGIAQLDTMLNGGYYRATSTLVTGSPGTAKTTLAGALVDGACKRGESALYVSFDEAANQIVRNLASVGFDLQAHRDAGLLHMYSIRTEVKSAEAHFVYLKKLITDLKPNFLVIDPISALAKTGGQIAAVHASLRLLDFAKAQGVTIFCTSLVSDTNALAEGTETQISTIADTWIHLSYVALGGERNRALTLIKSRGTKHSNQVRELILSDEGVHLADVYTSGGEVLMGTARWEKEAELRAEETRRRAVNERAKRELEQAESEVSAKIAALERELEARRAEMTLAEMDSTEIDNAGDRSREGILRIRAGQRESTDGDKAAVRSTAT